MTFCAAGRSSAPAIDVGGITWTYAQFHDAIDSYPSLTSFDASALTVPDALVCVFAALGRGMDVAVVDPAHRPEFPAQPRTGRLLLSTSGSSGHPRPLTRTPESWSSSFPAFTSTTGIAAGDRVLLTGPLHATMHLFAAVHALTVGACVTDRPESATVTHAVPARLRTVLASAPNLRVAVVGGASLDPIAQDMASERGIRVVEYYGAAELSLVALRVVPHPLRAFPGVELRIADSQIYSRSPFHADGASADTDGWATVGDMGRLDGVALTVLGRADAAITVGGTTVIAEDLEATLGTVNGVVDVAVIGTPHSSLGETVTAVVVLQEGADVADIRRRARSVVDRAAQPTAWIVRESLPRTPSGKLARARIQATIHGIE